MGHAINGNDEIALLLFSAWQRLDRQAQDILMQSNDDLSNSAYVEAEKRSMERCGDSWAARLRRFR